MASTIVHQLSAKNVHISPADVCFTWLISELTTRTSDYVIEFTYSEGAPYRASVQDRNQLGSAIIKSLLDCDVLPLNSTLTVSIFPQDGMISVTHQ